MKPKELRKILKHYYYVYYYYHDFKPYMMEVGILICMKTRGNRKLQLYYVHCGIEWYSVVFGICYQFDCCVGAPGAAARRARAHVRGPRGRCACFARKGVRLSGPHFNLVAGQREPSWRVFPN